ncbi:hypothetical protein OS189_01445 [Sulfitobacter sp. F26169L]|uniref:hypothetical protein n=1 Tax=Sulfitobacter sp. F26169L TaxID=2996015 RepID=UPI002260BF74|nr:hypothetical protein [Sulfitobacter sp. F26169L]MCX7565005.1 hypothetical protein [Sulfitobacter sp. F26169L]
MSADRAFSLPYKPLSCGAALPGAPQGNDGKGWHRQPDQPPGASGAAMVSADNLCLRRFPENKDFI